MRDVLYPNAHISDNLRYYLINILINIYFKTIVNVKFMSLSDIFLKNKKRSILNNNKDWERYVVYTYVSTYIYTFLLREL